MIKMFRASLAIALISLVAALTIPFERPLEVSFSIERPPVDLLLMSTCTLIALLLLPIAVYGLLRFRRRGRVVAVVVTIPLLGLLGLLTVVGTGNGIGSAATVSAKMAAAVAVVFWMVTVLLAFMPGVRGRFRSGGSI